LGPREFWVSVQTLFGLGVAFLTLAAFLLPRAWQQREARPLAKSDPENSLIEKLAPVSAATWERTRWLESDPFFWLASRDRSTGKMSWIIVGSLCAIWAGFCFRLCSIATSISPFLFV